MRTILAIVLLAMTGCLSDVPDATSGDRDGATDTPEDRDDTGGATDVPSDDARPIALAIDPVQPTRNASIVIAGTTDVPALLTWRSDNNATLPEPFEADGPWNIAVGIDHGRTSITVVADDGQGSQQQSVQVTRLSEVTVKVTYRGDVGMEDRNDPFWMDIDALASQQTGAYDGCSQGHPGRANVHDAMVAWTEATGRVVTYGECGDFGVSVEAIEGHESPGFWCYELNGEAADFGITLQPLEPGDTITWDDCALVLG